MEGDAEYMYSQVTYDQGCVNGGVPIVYFANGSLIRTVLSGYGSDIDLYQSGWLFRWTPYGGGYSGTP